MNDWFSPIESRYTQDESLPKMSEDQQAFLARWVNRSADIDGGIPSRADFPPNHFALLMSKVTVFDILHSPLDFHFRLMGTGVRENTHKDFTGINLSELDDKGPGSKRWTQLATVLRQKEPLYDALPYVGPRVSIKMVTVLLVPMASDHQNIDKIFQVTNFIKRQPVKLNHHR